MKPRAALFLVSDGVAAEIMPNDAPRGSVLVATGIAIGAALGRDAAQAILAELASNDQADHGARAFARVLERAVRGDA